ncbi:hypothetical protein NUW54_g9914 [Trametes sanguinea]|uniref:Uncharacterized protein n=1 Tax=Trametes sanguinea TaxID=158606 RepID=A0ACC1P5F3_9APHY|nr:hypothetical protein NUW54_g9914 [Trametes sanguinea]
MARRAASHGSHDSLKENNDVTPKTRANKATNDHAARGKRAAMREHIDTEEDGAERDARFSDRCPEARESLRAGLFQLHKIRTGAEGRAM